MCHSGVRVRFEVVACGGNAKKPAHQRLGRSKQNKRPSRHVDTTAAKSIAHKENFCEKPSTAQSESCPDMLPSHVNALLRKAPQQAARIQAKTRSLASTAAPTDSFAFYPVESHRGQGKHNPAPSLERECFSFYPSKGNLEGRKAINTQETAVLRDVAVQNKNSAPFRESIEAKWKSVIEERLNQPVKRNATTSQDSKQVSLTPSTAEDSFAFYPVEKNRVRSKASKREQESTTESRECFSFYPSNGVAGESKQVAAKNQETAVTTAVRSNEEVCSSVVDTATLTIEENALMAEDESTPSETNWGPVMQALKAVRKTTTTAVLP